LNPDDNSEFYSSFSGSFVFSELMRDQECLTFGKLRASWAQVGSANGVNPYENILTYAINPAFNGQTTTGVRGNFAPNPLIRPFIVTEHGGGMEMRLFNSNVLLDCGAFIKSAKDSDIMLL